MLYETWRFKKLLQVNLDKIPKSNKFDEFIEYFEKSWFPKSESDTTKYDFSLWSYYDKFDFRETKNN